MRPLIFSYLFAYLLFALGSPAFVRSQIELGYEPPALCETDSECLEHCPPPADDPDCDGGPQDPYWQREQARLCKLDSAHCE